MIEVCIVQTRAPQIGTAEIRVSKIASDNAGAGENRPLERHAAEGDLFQEDAPELCTLELPGEGLEQLDALLALIQVLAVPPARGEGAEHLAEARPDAEGDRGLGDGQCRLAWI